MAIAGIVLGAVAGFVQIFRLAAGYLKTDDESFEQFSDEDFKRSIRNAIRLLVIAVGLRCLSSGGGLLGERSTPGGGRGISGSGCNDGYG